MADLSSVTDGSLSLWEYMGHFEGVQEAALQVPSRSAMYMASAIIAKDPDFLNPDSLRKLSPEGFEQFKVHMEGGRDQVQGINIQGALERVKEDISAYANGILSGSDFKGAAEAYFNQHARLYGDTLAMRSMNEYVGTGAASSGRDVVDYVQEQIQQFEEQYEGAIADIQLNTELSISIRQLADHLLDVGAHVHIENGLANHDATIRGLSDEQVQELKQHVTDGAKARGLGEDVSIGINTRIDAIRGVDPGADADPSHDDTHKHDHDHSPSYKGHEPLAGEREASADHVVKTPPPGMSA